MYHVFSWIRIKQMYQVCKKNSNLFQNAPKIIKHEYVFSYDIGIVFYNGPLALIVSVKIF